MPSTFSSNLRFEIIQNGAQANTWGTTTNTNIGTLIEQSIAGLVSVDVTGADVTLTSLNGASDQARQMIINVTGAPSAARTVFAPTVSKVYIVANNSSKDVDIQTTALGVPYTIQPGLATIVYTDGTDFYSATGDALPTTGGTISGNLNVLGALTKSGYTVLNANNFNTYAPTNTGTGASGTWGINISGNAATATSATNATNATYASNPASGGSFITSSNIGSQSVNYASSAGTAGSATNITAYTINQSVGTSNAPTFAGLQVNGSINATGNVTAYGPSDRNLKESIETIEAPLKKIEQIRGVTFDWTDAYLEANGGEDGFFIRKQDVGLIAQEVQQIIPEAVAEKPDGYLGIQYTKVIPLLVECIKELSEKVKALESRHDA